MRNSPVLTIIFVFIGIFKVTTTKPVENVDVVRYSDNAIQGDALPSDMYEKISDTLTKLSTVIEDVKDEIQYKLLERQKEHTKADKDYPMLEMDEVVDRRWDSDSVVDSTNAIFKTDVAKEDPIKTDVAKDDPIKTDVAKEDPIKTDVAKEDPIKTDVAKEDPIKNDVAKEDPLKTDVARDDPVKTDVAKEDPIKTDVPKEDPIKTDVAKEDPIKTDVDKEDPMKAENANEDAVKNFVAKEDPIKTDVADEDTVKTVGVIEVPIKADVSIEDPINNAFGKDESLNSDASKPSSAEVVFNNPAEEERRSSDDLKADMNLMKDEVQQIHKDFQQVRDAFLGKVLDEKTKKKLQDMRDGIASARDTLVGLFKPLKGKENAANVKDMAEDSLDEAVEIGLNDMEVVNESRDKEDDGMMKIDPNEMIDEEIEDFTQYPEMDTFEEFEDDEEIED